RAPSPSYRRRSPAEHATRDAERLMLGSMYQRRVAGLVLAIASVGMILTAVLTQTWWGVTAGKASTSVGLRSAEVCVERERGSSSRSEVRRIQPDPDDYGPTDRDRDLDRDRDRGRKRTKSVCES